MRRFNSEVVLLLTWAFVAVTTVATLSGVVFFGFISDNKQGASIETALCQKYFKTNHKNITIYRSKPSTLKTASDNQLTITCELKQ